MAYASGGIFTRTGFFIKSYPKCWLLFQADGSLILNQQHAVPTDKEISFLQPSFVRQFLLGVQQGKAYYCAELAPGQDVLSCTLQAWPLRQALSLLPYEQYGVAVRASSILNWDRQHQYCGACGAKTMHPRENFERVCSQCQLSFFPRISPSIIVRIRKGDQILMARSPHFAPGVYGLIAGFVDAGESLEETVHREVKEEVGITIKNLAYFHSQPWPFPDSLMMAFTADHAEGEIKIDQREIEAAGWYPHDQLPGRPSIACSIGTALVDDFIASF
ncbi:MAG: NAD(+) diphosphatase [Legionellales bacterium]|nr:NAD(+) diphosphatase [Legionellales bacterium]